MMKGRRSTFTMNNTLLKLGLKAASLASLVAPFAAFGQSTPPPLPGPSGQLTTPGGVLQFLCGIAGWIFAFLIVLAIIFILIAAFRYLTAQGDAEKVQGANQALLFSAVAVAVAVIAKAVPLVVSGFLGASNVNTC